MASGWVSGMSERIRWPGSFLWERGSVASPVLPSHRKVQQSQPFSCEAGEGGAKRRMRARAQRAAFAFLPLPSAKVKSSASLRSRALIRPSGTFSRKREKGCIPTRAALLPRYACPPSQPAAAAAPAPVPATSHKPQATATMPTPANRRALTAALPPLPDADARVIEAFTPAIWAESGLAPQSLDRYRHDLAGYARGRDASGRASC